MVLESLNNLNIKRMVLEAPEKVENDLPFDVERDITQEDWDNMVKKLEDYRTNKHWGDFARQAMEMKILNSTIDLKLDTTAWEGMGKELEYNRINKEWVYFTQQAMNMKILNPSVDLKFDGTAWDGMEKELERYRMNKNWWNFAQQAMRMKILAAEEVRVTNNGIELTMPKPKVKPVKDIPPMPETKKF